MSDEEKRKGDEKMQPTTKQINYLMALIRAKYESEAYAYICDCVGKSKMHRERITMSGASRAIEQAKTATK